MINISGILNSKTTDISYEALKKTEFLCERAKELADSFFESGKQDFLDQSVKLLTEAALINRKNPRIYISLSHTCIKLELFETARDLLTRVIEIEPANLIAKNMLKIVNKKITVNKNREKSQDRVNLTKKFGKLFSIRNKSSNIKVKVSKGTFSKLVRLFQAD